MRRLLECVPNFSEGQDKAVIRDIAAAIEAVAGVFLLDVDPGRDAHRTVVTFVGEPEAVVEAAFQSMREAARLIDMAVHRGTHPRMGATDVCPLVPLQGIGVDACVALAEALAERAAERLGIPIYLYGKAARRPDRVRLPDIRKGGYEALPQKLADPAFKPDFGEAIFNPRSGATVIGVRDLLLAYNVNLSTRDPRPARQIARAIRKSGYPKRDANQEDTIVPGRLTECQADGWYIPAYGRAQVTMNLTDFRRTGLHTAFEAVAEEAEKRGLEVTGSELVGMVPLAAMLDTGRHFLLKAKKKADARESEIVQQAILGLGLNDVVPFDPQSKIIEYAMAKRGYTESAT